MLPSSRLVHLGFDLGVSIFCFTGFCFAWGVEC